MASANYAKGKVQKFLSGNKCQHLGERNDKDIWLHPDGVTVMQIPLRGGVPWDIFQMIAIDQLQMNHHEFDYWVGQNC